MTYDVDKFRAAQEALLRAENAYRLKVAQAHLDHREIENEELRAAQVALDLDEDALELLELRLAFEHELGERDAEMVEVGRQVAAGWRAHTLIEEYRTKAISGAGGVGGDPEPKAKEAKL